MITAESVWTNCLKFIKDNIQIQAYKTWFEPIKPIKFENNVLSVQVPSKFFYEWLEEHYVKLLKLALNKELGENARLIYVIKMENTFGNLSPFTEKIPSQYKTHLPSQKVENDAELKFIRRDLDAAIDSLSKDLKIAFTLNAEGFKYHEISEELNIPIGTIKTRIFIARRILREKFRLGLFDHPYLDPAGVKILNNAQFAAKGIEAQQKSLVLLKNEANVLPLKSSTKIFLDGFSEEETKAYPNVVSSMEAADVIVLKIGTPDNAGSEKYILQRLFNHGSLAFSEKEEARLLKIIQSKPTITVINLQRPAVIPAINQYSKALIADFSSKDNVILDLIMGKFKPSGKLPFELPSPPQQHDVPAVHRR